MKRQYRHFAVVGTLCCVGAVVVLWMAVLTLDWVQLQEPQVDQLELDKLGPYEEPKPHLIRAKFGLFRVCLQQVNSFQYGTNPPPAGTVNQFTQLQLRNGGTGLPIECHDLDWYNFGIFNFQFSRKSPQPMPSELISNCVEKLRFTLPFIGLSVVFTSIAFLCLIFGHFCQKNKKIIEATMLILGGLCQATALLTFVAQIGSEFEANLPFSHHQSRLTTFYRYKYGYSFYLFLISFGLSELGAFFDMLAYFRKYPPSHYVITFHRQELPYSGGGGSGGPPSHPGSAQGTLGRSQNNCHHHHHLLQYHGDDSAILMSNFHHLPPPSPPQHFRDYPPSQGGPDLCSNDFNTHSVPTEHLGLTVRRVEGSGSSPPPQSYINPEVTITTIERTGGTYGTLKNPRTTQTTPMESFGTLRKENNV